MNNEVVLALHKVPSPSFPLTRERELVTTNYKNATIAFVDESNFKSPLTRERVPERRVRYERGFRGEVWRAQEPVLAEAGTGSQLQTYLKHLFRETFCLFEYRFLYCLLSKVQKGTRMTQIMRIYTDFIFVNH